MVLDLSKLGYSRTIVDRSFHMRSLLAQGFACSSRLAKVVELVGETNAPHPVGLLTIAEVTTELVNGLAQRRLLFGIGRRLVIDFKHVRHPRRSPLSKNLPHVRVIKTRCVPNFLLCSF